MVLACIVMGTRCRRCRRRVVGWPRHIRSGLRLRRSARGTSRCGLGFIILAVVTAASMMQAAGGIDWMVAMAARVIEVTPGRSPSSHPRTAFAFCVGSGTGNIIYPLLPVIYDVSYKNHIRPARPLTLTVVQSGMALAASPVSAAMAAMLTLTEVALQPRTDPDPGDHPASVHHRHRRDRALVVNRMWKDLDDDPEVQRASLLGCSLLRGAPSRRSRRRILLALLPGRRTPRSSPPTRARRSPRVGYRHGPHRHRRAPGRPAPPSEPVSSASRLTYTKEGATRRWSSFSG